VSKFFIVATNICGSSLWNIDVCTVFLRFENHIMGLFFVNLVTPRIVRWLLNVLKILCTYNIKVNLYLNLKITLNSGSMPELEFTSRLKYSLHSSCFVSLNEYKDDLECK
jgi:hypothetical protein